MKTYLRVATHDVEWTSIFQCNRNNVQDMWCRAWTRSVFLNGRALDRIHWTCSQLFSDPYIYAGTCRRHSVKSSRKNNVRSKAGRDLDKDSRIIILDQDLCQSWRHKTRFNQRAKHLAWWPACEFFSLFKVVQGPGKSFLCLIRDHMSGSKTGREQTSR